MTLKQTDNPIVMTLDAGGTNLVFSAVSNQQEIVEPYVLPAHGHDLDKCLRNIINGFEAIVSKLKEKPVAISFAFPGPADYANGIIGDLGNLPGFRGGVALGPMLEDRFGMPVFINNDGDLFAYGEAMFGLLPYVNHKLKEQGSIKQFHNLAAFTLGTGFGGGLVCNGQLFRGDNGVAAEVWLLRNPMDESINAEESISARAITGEYKNLGGNGGGDLTPRDVYDIAKGLKKGNQQAALDSFTRFGRALGMAVAEVATLTDSLIAIGGGLASAQDLFFPAMISELNGSFATPSGDTIPRLIMKVHNLDNDEDFSRFAQGQSSTIQVPYSSRQIEYDPAKRIGVGVSRLGASKAISLGAYAYALNELGVIKNQ